MYLQRKIDFFLLDWKANSERKPLIVKGSRQVGKTESIKRFGLSEYESFIYINFVEEPKYKMITSDGYSVEDIVKNISRIDPSKRFLPHQTLIVFDELQAYPEIATALKFFAIDKRFDVICSGSLLGIHYRKIESNSVGYKTDFIMHSLDFEEFLWAKGYSDDFVQDIFQHMVDKKPFNELLLSVCESLFLDYCILGGMPAIVRDYMMKGTFEGSLETQRQIILDYQEDMRKYADGMDQARLMNVFHQIPLQLAKKNKKFQISKLSSGARFKDYRGCIEWLNDAGIIVICYCLHFPELPLRGNYDDTKYKLYFADTGLLVAMLDDESQEDLRANRNLGVYKGALYENIAADALIKSGLPVYYYKKEDSSLEEDFFVRTSSSLIPVEVKATKGTAKSLTTLIQSDHYPDISLGIKFHQGNLGQQANIQTFPHFCIFLLKRYLKTLSQAD